MVLPITDGSLLSDVVQKRLVSTATAGAFSPSSDGVDQPAEHRPEAHHVEEVAVDDAGVDDARIAEADQRELDGGEFAERVDRRRARRESP